ncbi:MAG TPA: dienelactone hydrolase family protein [Candidatus Saccharimonadales bacterium]|nr:dienelactone hydrolase family protein [Candidatus Saccharimonadales bacterium]
MAEKIVSMHAAHRSGKEVVDGFLSRPIAGGERPAIVLVHGYRGLDDGQRAVTRRFAQEGFVCLSPDLFHGKTYHTLEECALKKTSLDIPAAVNHIVDSVPYLRKLPWVGKKKVAVLGFCMGGGLALYALAQSRAFAAGVIYYQSLFPDPEDLKSISAPMLCHFGTDDPGTTKTEIDMFRETLERYKKKYEIEMYEGAGHAFLNNPQGKNAANRDAAEKSVARTTKWLRKALA